jgi:hypothetical protein
MNKVALIVPDAGPLISLARANALDVLLALEIPIYIIDHVLYEVGKPEFIDGQIIRQFVAEHADRIHEFETFVGKQAKAVRDAGFSGRQPGLGEAAISEFLSKYDLEFDDMSPMLLFEDSDISKRKIIVPDSVHVTSTMKLLKGLELDGLIPSAQAIWDAIEATGRKPSKVEIDRPGENANGSSFWRRGG